MSFVCRCLLALAACFRKNVSAMLATVAVNIIRNDTSNTSMSICNFLIVAPSKMEVR